MGESRRHTDIEQRALRIAAELEDEQGKAPVGGPAPAPERTTRMKELLGLKGQRTVLYDRVYHVGLALVCVVAFALMTYLAATTSLWLDEIFQVDYCLSSSLLDVVLIDPYTPPLFNIIAWIWYQLVPYGEVWLRLPSIVFVVASMPLAAATGRRIGGRRTGFLAAFLLLINAKVFTQMGLTFRTYALLLFLSTLLVYLYVRRTQTPKDKTSWKLSVASGATMLALGYTHYFGVLLACAFFLVDVFLLVRGHLNGIRRKVLVSYLIPVVGYLPWVWVAFQTLFAARANAAAGFSVDTWQGTGDAVNIHALLYWLCGECAETLGLFHIAMIVIVVVGVYHCYRHRFVWQEEMPLIALVFVVFAVVGGMWAYCSFIEPESMFWVERYFTPAIPAMTLVTAWGITRVFSWIPTSDPVRFVAAFLCVVLLVPTATGTIRNDLALGSSTRFYADLTTYLESRDDISNDDTLVLAIINTTDRGRQVNAWKHYYFDRKDTRDFKVNIWEGLEPSIQVNPYDLLAYDTIYVTCQHFDPDIPEAYAEVFQEYYKRHRTDNPGGGTTVYYTKK